MSTLVVAFRIAPLLGFAGAMLLSPSRHRGRAHARAIPSGSRAPVVANVAAFAVYVAALLMFSRSSTGSAALLLASSGALLALAGAAVVVKSRAALGPAW